MSTFRGIGTLVFGLALLLTLFPEDSRSVTLCPPAFTFTSEAAAMKFSYSVASAGDVNNDGYPGERLTSSAGAESTTDDKLIAGVSNWEVSRFAHVDFTPNAVRRIGSVTGQPWKQLRNLGLWNTLWDVFHLPGTDFRWAVGGSWYGPDSINTSYGNPVVCRSGSWATGWEIFQPEVGSDSLPDANIHFYCLHFVNELEGWVGGEADGMGQTAVIYHTTDGGLTWAKQYEGALGPSHLINDLSFVDEQTGWAAGSIDQDKKIAILHTQDGGVTWTPQVTGIDAAVTHVDFLDTQVGFSTANLGYTLGTVDGGDTWTILSQEPLFSQGLLGMDFVNDTLGFGSNVGSLVLRTVDGALSWDVVADAPRRLCDIEMLDKMVGWAVGDYGTVLRTSDGGDTWTVIEWGAYVKDLKACSPVDGLTLWCVGRSGTIAYTLDGGNVWGQVDGDRYITSTLLKDVEFTDEFSGWISGTGGEILRTTDGGMTWTHLGQPTNRSYDAIDFVDQNEGWAVGSAVYHTTDGGNDWQLQLYPGVSLTDVCFITPSLGWVCGAYGAIFRTADGGNTWDTLESGTSQGLYGLYFVNESAGWCVGWAGVIIRTLDGGENWEVQASGVTNSLYSVSFVDSQNGWVAGLRTGLDPGFVLHTSDGGQSWQIQYEASSQLRTVHFSDLQTGCAAGGVAEHSLVVCTEDGGNHWEECDVPNQSVGILRVGRKLTGVFLLNPSVRFAVGEQGSVLKAVTGFLCGDINGDETGPNVADLTYLVDYLFFEGSPPPILESANVDGEGGINVADLTYLVDYLFFGGPEPDCQPIR